MPTLYIVATPIGNMEDITQRAIETLKKADLILCEDTRVTKKLLDRLEILTPAMSYHQHSKLPKIQDILKFAQQGKVLALVSDAGTPGISDPGNQLIEIFVKEFGEDAKIIPIPGASAMASAACIAGFSMDKFCFFGFPPVKNKRQKYFKELLEQTCPVIFYESCYRIIKSLEDIQAIDPKAYVVVCRELTKMFETIYRGEIGEAIQKVKKDPIKGEFTIIVKR